MLRIMIVIVALTAGGGAAWLATQQTASTAAPAVVEPTPAVTRMASVLVAARDVPRGEQVTTEGLRWQPWPIDAVPQSFIVRSAKPDGLTELAAYFANRPIALGEPITEQALSNQANGFLAATLAPGKRAVAIQVDAQSSAGGFILPNDRVDVIHTVRVARESGTDAQSRTLLRSVRVLAIDQTTEDTDSGTVLGKTATLELTEAQVEAVTSAGTSGTLSLSLRPLEDSPGETSLELEKPRQTIRERRGTVIEDVVIN